MKNALPDSNHGASPNYRAKPGPALDHARTGTPPAPVPAASYSPRAEPFDYANHGADDGGAASRYAKARTNLPKPRGGS